MSFKDSLKELRKSKKLSRKALGELSGVSPNSIAKYEYGMRKPGIEAIIKLSKALEVNPRVLLDSLTQYEELIDAILELESSD